MSMNAGVRGVPFSMIEMVPVFSATKKRVSPGGTRIATGWLKPVATGVGTRFTDGKGGASGPTAASAGGPRIGPSAIPPSVVALELEQAAAAATRLNHSERMARA